MHFEFIDSITDVKEHEWNRLWKNQYPFTQFQFLHALEISGCTITSTGWSPRHLIAREKDKLVFAMPCFLKTHSYGEYVFDWRWADAYQRYGIPYYPKLLNAIPFTPTTGPRFAMDGTLEGNSEFSNALYKNITAYCLQEQISGFHSLFPESEQQRLWHSQTMLQRTGCQFHWFNQGFQSFDDFLSLFASRKRKNIRKERQKCAHFDISLTPASELNDEHWHIFYQLYQQTYLKRSGHTGYLNADFFLQLAHSMPEQLLLANAKLEGETVAAAVYFRDDDCLYGRYWGSTIEADGLHFETCYYQGIEYAIREKLQRFDPGAQGEHKIQRGFQSVATASYHWLAQPEFHDALAQFCDEERQHIQHYIDDARTYLPFKEGTEVVDDRILMTEI